MMLTVNTTLLRLNLKNNRIGDVGGVALAHSLKQTSIAFD